MRAAAVALGLALCAGSLRSQSAGTIVVGSKNFTESCVLGELMAQMLEAHTELAVERRLNLGGTTVCWAALRSGEIDLYADYTGTGWAILLKEPGRISDPLRAYLHVRRRFAEEFDVRWLEPFGLDNSYALAMNEAKAQELGVTRISDLTPHQGRLRAGFSIEFMNREDGYPGLARAYGLALGDVRALEHGLAYTAIEAGEIDLIDAYTTDGKLLRYRLRVLADDRGFFPPYNAAPLVREATLRAHPEIVDVLRRLAFRVPDEQMQRLNYRVEEEGLTFAAAARGFLEREGMIDPDSGAGTGRARRRAPSFFGLMAQRAGVTARLAAEHVGLTLLAVLLAGLVAVPIGIAIARWAAPRRIALGLAGVVQTIPSLALLAFMIPFLGLGVGAAVAALFLYAVLPILRNTYTGLVEVDPDLIEAAHGMGMRERQILGRVQLPLAMRTIMAGVRTSAVISIGVATLAAFIGAGGLGEPIVTGLYLNDTNLILAGAVPAAALAIAADFALGWLERWLAPRTGGAG